MFPISLAQCQRALSLLIVFAFTSLAAGWISQSNNIILAQSSFRRSVTAMGHFSRRRQAAAKVDIPTINSKNNTKDLLVIAWEGCLVDTLEWRIETGLKAAFEVWPELEIMTMDSADLTWLYNKLGALQHVLTPPTGSRSYYYSPAVEYGLAIRMLLEEQELDEGRSNGSKGKYGSRFHPSAQDKAFAASTNSITSSSSNTAPTTATATSSRSDNFNAQRRGRRQQRPLTVGEIAANWQETLREAIMIRYYNEDKENPLDQLHDAILRIQKTYNDDAEEKGVVKKLQLLPDMASMLQDRLASPSSSSACSVIVTVHHEMDLPVARRSIQNALSLSALSSSSLPMIHICENLSELSASDMQNDSSIWIVCTHKTSSSSSTSSSSTSALATLTSIMAACSEDTMIHVVESSWSQLEAYIPLFGDCIPRQRQGTSTNIGECILLDKQECSEKHDPNDDTGRRFLQLCLGQWASHPDSQTTAIMNPWTTVMSFQELIAAVRIMTGQPQPQQHG